MNDFEIKDLPGNKAAIITKKEFDREKNPRYFLTVIADDISPSDRINHKPFGTPNSGETDLNIHIFCKVSVVNRNKVSIFKFSRVFRALFEC